MTHEDAFIDAIRAAPQDDHLQLIYADWLEERGDASALQRGDFLRTQSEIRQRMRKRQRDTSRREALSVRLRQLRASIDPAWFALLHRTKVPLYPPQFDALFARWRTQFTAFEVPLNRSLSGSRLRPVSLSVMRRFNETVTELVAAYLEGDCRQCQAMRGLVRTRPAVRWFLHRGRRRIQRTSTKVRLLRFDLALISLRDQGEDIRDEMLLLGAVLTRADRAGIDPVPHLEEIAAVCSSGGGQGMGSMRGLFTRTAKEGVCAGVRWRRFTQGVR